LFSRHLKVSSEFAETWFRREAGHSLGKVGQKREKVGTFLGYKDVAISQQHHILEEIRGGRLSL